MIRFFSNLLIALMIPILIGLYMPEESEVFHYPEYPELLDGPFTGGFGEQSCHSCHFSYDLNDSRGKLLVEGISNRYKPDQVYKIEIRLEHEEMKNGGFQLTARFEDGTQAGEFEWVNDRLAFTPERRVGTDVKYLQHTAEGSELTSNQKINWIFYWKAPSEGERHVIFNIAANAGNDDLSAFGDWVYLKELTLNPK